MWWECVYAKNVSGYFIKNQMEYKLKIDKPCKVDWDSMETVNDRKFCQNCQHTVIDFSPLNDFQIERIVTNNKGNICGRFTRGQLNRTLIPITINRNSFIFHKTFAGILLLSALENNEVSAQNIITPIISEKYIGNNNIEITFIDINDTDSSINVLHGKIIDGDTKEPLYLAILSIANTSISCFTDTNGNFMMALPDSLHMDSLTFTLRYPGYITHNITINANYLCSTNKPLTFGIETSVMGLIGVEIVKRKKWWQFWKKSSY
jgi:hypothetical protein